ncbi:uncharacterized protein LOC6523723 isoform X2 [Drosophila yakuba]|uniref:Uncharacterized protein, isoform A n=1 Tax=Drosophila yakuba TaxID=7245 RepID=B4PW05_DROYA|nr:uncharacterized protein LOC6523723 isoform X2 [Drosophila yakuba]EDW99310.2 uncharacterized protein Dyak_GE14516, isoform A [Drosophila yakuba]
MKLRCFNQAQTTQSWHPRSAFRVVSSCPFDRIDRPSPASWQIYIGHLPTSLLRMFKMDSSDFWQQARAPFGLQTALHQYSSPSNQQPISHHALHHSLQQEHEQLSESHPEGPAALSGAVGNSSSMAISGTNPTGGSKAESSHMLQQHLEQQSYGSDSFRGAQSPQLSSHHLLFNAAAAAAAAAHLKSTAMQNNLSPIGDQAQNNLRDYGQGSLNALCGIKPKQEMDAKTLLQPLDVCSQPLVHAQSQPQYGGDFYDVVDPQAREVSEPEGRALIIGLGVPSMGSTDDAQSSLQAQQLAGTGRALQTRQCKPMSPGTGGSSNSGAGRRSAPTTINKTFSQGQQSPQHSTTPSGGSTTPDIKYNNDKMTNEIQLQLSRSSSAAAISERTLEECWSTLQRLFMHKSAMQQIQQQIPRVGLGTHGVTGSASLGGSITPSSDTKPHQCQQCMKSFSSNHQLVQHIRVHTGEKPYKCSYCDRRFKQLSHVQQHTRLHTGERPYKCHLPDCGRAFIQLSNLQQHLRNHDAQVERAKNRPFHCNICGKGFATESSLRTHTSKELQLHLGVLQQHAALIGGPNATSCPVCHKLFLGTEALLDHMRHVHKEKSPPPGGSAPSQFSELNQIATGNGNENGTGRSNEQIASQCTTESNSHQATVGSSLIDSFLGKRRTANHPCPVCGKHYVNEGSLRKHLACHAESSQLTNSLRMWPCSVCQAVFTHENGLLTHMESMRMDPKHQFAAQYVLSRAAAEQRERESLLAVTLAASSGAAGPRIGIADAGNVLPMGAHNSEGSNSKCPSPSANSECSSNGRLSSSNTSDQDQDIEHGLSENENSNQNNISSSTNNNNNCTNNNSSSHKMAEIRLPGSGQYTMDAELHVANRMSLMAAAAAAVAASRPQDGVDTSAVPSAAVQAAVVNLAAAMRMNNSSNGATSYQQQHGDQTQALQPHIHPHHHQQQQAPQHQQQQLSHLLVHTHPSNSNCRSQSSPNINVPTLQNESSSSASIAMNMNVHMMRGSLEPDPSLGGMNAIEVLHQHQQHHHHHHHTSNYPQHAVTPTNQQTHPHSQTHHTSHHHPSPETALRMHQAEAIIRSHTEAAFRLATGSGPGTGVKCEADQNKLSSNGNAGGNSGGRIQQHRFHANSNHQENQRPSDS